MPIYVVCQCGKHYGFKNEAAGRKVNCPACGKELALPDRAAGPKPEAEAKPVAPPAPKAAAGSAAEPELRFANEPESEPDLMSAFELDAAGQNAETEAEPEPESPPAGRNKVALMVGIGIGGAAVTVGIIALVAALMSGPATPKKDTVSLSAKSSPSVEAPAADTSSDANQAAPATAIQTNDPGPPLPAPAPETAAAPEAAAAPPIAPAAAPAAPAVPSKPALVLPGPRFAEVRLSPDKFRDTTVQWYGEFQSAEGSRLIFVGARSSGDRAPYRFIALFSPGTAPTQGSGVVTGKVLGTESITEPLAGGGMGRFALAVLPLVAEATFQPESSLSGRPEMEIIQAAPSAAPPAARPAAPAAAPAAPSPAAVPVTAPAATPPAPAVSAAPAAAPAPAVATPPAQSPPAGEPAEPTVQNPPPEKEREALRLLKKCTTIAVSFKTPPTVNVSQEEAEAYNRAGQFAQTYILSKGPADALRLATAEISKCGPHVRFIITLFVAEGPALEQIREILGTENRSETREYFQKGNPDARIKSTLTEAPGPDKLPVTWYHYGWLAFGEAGGKVVAVRADCQKLK